MKRRDFLIQSAAGAMLPILGRAAPCPPPTLGVQGGTTANTLCGSASADAEADWISRSTGPGVVWSHDFRSAAEVDQFRWSGGVGSDPNNTGRPFQCNHITTDGITGGGCLEMYNNGTGSDATHWIRPFAPLAAGGNGKTTDDPAAGGSIPLRTWAFQQGQANHNQFPYGWYGHSQYLNNDPTHFDGTEFWLQYRVKRDIRRVTNGNQNNLVGKLNYVTCCENFDVTGLANQELVVYSNGGGTTGAATSGQNSVRMYGGWALFDPLDQEAGHGDIQPGGVSPIWQWALDGTWDTMMIHLRPGRTNVDETLIELYGAHQGETSFTLFWQQTFAMWAFDTRNGFQCVYASVYNNNYKFSGGWYDRHDQYIFSTQPIPCPQV